MLLARSRRYSGCSCRWVVLGRGQVSGQGLPTPICCPYSATRPHHSTGKLSPVYATGNTERVSGKRRESLPKCLCARVPTGWGEKEIEEMLDINLCASSTDYWSLLWPRDVLRHPPVFRMFMPSIDVDYHKYNDWMTSYFNRKKYR